MMGPSHALSGAAVWLAGSLALQQLTSYHPSPIELAVGTAVCAGGALMPDLDMSGRVTSGRGGATVANAFGRLTLFLAEVIEKFSLILYRLTSMRHDPHRDNGHRTLTHTIVFNVAVGVGTWQLCLHFGKWAVLGVLFVMLGLALRGLFHRWAERAGWVLITALSAGAAYYTYEHLDGGRGYPILGVAVGVGGLVHLAGDVVTRHGCPLFWPVPVRAHRMWHCVGVPDALAIEVGGKVETILLRLVFTAVAISAGGWLVAPTLLERFNIAL